MANPKAGLQSQPPYILAGNFSLFKDVNISNAFVRAYYFYTREWAKKGRVGGPHVRVAVFLTMWDFHADVIIFERYPILTKGCSVALAGNHNEHLSHLWHLSCSMPNHQLLIKEDANNRLYRKKQCIEKDPVTSCRISPFLRVYYHVCPYVVLSRSILNASIHWKIIKKQERIEMCVRLNVLLLLLPLSIWTCVIKSMKLRSNEISVGVYKREDGPTRPDGNKSSSGTREEVTGQTRAK